MKPTETQSGKSHILYDAELPVQTEPVWFEPGAWRARGQLLASASGGRGEAVFCGDGRHEYVLRHYRRGGLPGRFIRDRYLWTGLENTRAWREWRLTAELYGRGLPVPRPVAARVERSGLFYRADLMTLRIPAARSLAQVLASESLPEPKWRAIGQCLRRFHDNGLDHADLNAHNILLSGEAVYLIDFDRCRLRAPGAWQQANLARLLRSLRKLQHEDVRFAFAEPLWAWLQAGYRAQNGASAVR